MIRKRYEPGAAVFSFIMPALLFGALLLLILYWSYPQFHLLKHGVIIVLGLFAMWRYGWMLINYLRAALYATIIYPRLRRRAEAVDPARKYPRHLYFMIPSYREDAWVTRETFRALIREIDTIPSEVTIVVSTASSGEDALIRRMFEVHAKETTKSIKLIFQHQQSGKRIAMGHALRTISREYHRHGADDPDSVTIFMDGDSRMEPGFLRRLLPFFAIDPKIGALTTNETAFIDSKSPWYRDWFHLKFGQRHIAFQSHALSRKVLTLTGRLSAYRTRIVIENDFIELLEHDIITDPVHGKFRFLMGDDKSTWYYLLKQGWDMLYLPDLLCTSLESRDGKFWELSRSLPYRWFGNTLRNNSRALALGPRKTGWFIWYAIFDQRVVMWSSLVGISSALILAFSVSFYYLLFFLVWVVFVRLMQLLVITLFGHRVSWRMVPLLLYTQWMGALVKIRAFYNLADQRWSKSGSVQSGDETRVHIDHPLVPLLPKIMLLGSTTLFVTLLLAGHGVLKLPELLTLPGVEPLLSHHTADTAKEGAKGKAAEEVIDLSDYGVRPGAKDCAKIISRLIAQHDPNRRLLLQLGEGRYDLYAPIVIGRSHVTLAGLSAGKTVLRSHLHSGPEGVIQIVGRRGRRVGYLAENIYRNQSAFTIETRKKIPHYLLLRQPNDPRFVASLGAKRWYRRYPYLRQEIVEVLDYDPQKHRVYTAKPILTDFEAGKTEVIALEMAEDVHLQDFTIKQMHGDDRIESVRHDYRNRYRDSMVDAIAFHYAAKSGARDLAILQSGSDAIDCNYAYGLTLGKLQIDGSWNKGKKGNGYVRFARTWYSLFRESSVRNIRHVTLQWSAAGNRFYDLLLGVDINLHGGFAHENRIDHITFDIPHAHRWGPIEACPQDAKWAPPDGKNEILYDTFRYLKGSKR